MDKAVLVMTFRDALDKPFTIKVNDPKADLDGNEVEQVMAMMISRKVFPKDGVLIAAQKAEIVKTQTQQLFNEQ